MSTADPSRPRRAQRRPGRRIAFLQALDISPDSAPAPKSSPSTLAMESRAPPKSPPQQDALDGKRPRDNDEYAVLLASPLKRARGRPIRGKTISYHEYTPPVTPPPPPPPVKRKRGRPRRKPLHSPSALSNSFSPSEDSTPVLVSGLPRLRLWNEDTQEITPKPYSVDDVEQILANDHALTLYVGQDDNAFPSFLETKGLVSSDGMRLWRREMTSRGVRRRVMVFDPSLCKILDPINSPKIRNLRQFLTTKLLNGRVEDAPRVYAAQYTDYAGLVNPALDLIELIVKGVKLRMRSGVDDAFQIEGNIADGQPRRIFRHQEVESNEQGLMYPVPSTEKEVSNGSKNSCSSKEPDNAVVNGVNADTKSPMDQARGLQKSPANSYTVATAADSDNEVWQDVFGLSMKKSSNFDELPEHEQSNLYARLSVSRSNVLDPGAFLKEFSPNLLEDGLRRELEELRAVEARPPRFQLDLDTCDLNGSFDELFAHLETDEMDRETQADVKVNGVDVHACAGEIKEQVQDKINPGSKMNLRSREERAKMRDKNKARSTNSKARLDSHAEITGLGGAELRSHPDTPGNETVFVPQQDQLETQNELSANLLQIASNPVETTVEANPTVSIEELAFAKVKDVVVEQDASAKGSCSFDERIRNVEDAKVSFVGGPAQQFYCKRLTETNESGKSVEARQSTCIAHQEKNCMNKFRCSHVYLWSKIESRSGAMFTVEDAISICMRTAKGFQIYCGQDYDFRGGVHRSRLLGKLNQFVKAASKRGHRKRIEEKVRMYDRTKRELLPYASSPSTRTFLEWRSEHPDAVVFHPSMLDPSHGVPSTKDQRHNQHLCGKRKLRYVVARHVVPILRKMRVVNMTETELLASPFWNTLDLCDEIMPKRTDRAEVVRHLILNPWIEVLREQEALERMREEDGFQVVPIMTSCPARLACFWDKQANTKYMHSEKSPGVPEKSIWQCLSENRTLELYLGQDTPYYDAVKSYVAGCIEGGSFPYAHMLAYCGKLLHETMRASDWIALYVDEVETNTASAVFYNFIDKSLLMQPDMPLFKSIRAYQAENSKEVEIYVGQDMSQEVQRQLSSWFELLTYRPGFCRSTHRGMLTKRKFLSCNIPVGHIQAMRDDGISVSDVQCMPDVFRSPRNFLAETDKHAPVMVPHQATTGVPTAENLQKSSDAHVAAQKETLGLGSKRGKFRKSLSAQMPNSREVSQNTTNCSEEILNGSAGDPVSPFLRYTAGPQINGQEDATNGERIGAPDGGEECDDDILIPNCLADISVEKAMEQAIQASQLMCQAGPKVLNRELNHDLRDGLREELILLVSSTRHLEYLAQKFQSPTFVNRAAALCMRLERLDSYNCFRDGFDSEYGAPGLSKLREDFETGKTYTIASVVDNFRYICEDLKQYHFGTILHSEAVLLGVCGEKVILEFLSESKDLMKDEKTISSIHFVCERAASIGFRKCETDGKTTKPSAVTSPDKLKPSLKVLGQQSEVTFLNYRDEKGHSVMGKRHSARVLGLSLDTSTCERKRQDTRPCHVCHKECARSDGDSLLCSNHSFDLCNEAVCRNCLELTFHISKAEFMLWRQEGDWLCVHCRGLCLVNRSSDAHDGSRCRSGSDTLCPTVNVYLAWSFDVGEARSVLVKCTRRSLAGDFEDWNGSTYVIQLERNHSCSSWHADVALQTGVYRCRVEVDGVWLASTVGKISREEKKSFYHDDVAFRNVAGKPLRRPVGWRVSKRVEDGQVHSFSREDGGRMVQQCVRTEGYDWRRSKRHPIMQWIPELKVTTNDERQCSKPITQASIRLSACLSASDVSLQRPGFPRFEVGQSYTDFLERVRAFKFDYMYSQTVGGILTGKSKIHGVGLFTLTGYQRGDYVIEYAGDLVRMSVADVREQRYDAAGLGTYFFRIDDNNVVDATAKSNRARFTNHSCDPNMAAEIVNVRGRDLVVLVATREISPYSELTFNYQLPEEDEKIHCLCGSWNCVGVMN